MKKDSKPFEGKTDLKGWIYSYTLFLECMEITVNKSITSLFKKNKK